MGVAVWPVALSAFLAVPAGKLPVKCSIAVDGKEGVEVSVASRSSAAIEEQVHTVLILEPSKAGASPGAEDGYWAPVDVGTARHYGANQPRHLSLSPGQILRSVLSPKALLWDRSISSMWPSRTLVDAVPSGRYSLYLEVEGPAPSHIRVRSNRLVAIVENGRLSLMPGQQ
jgi:hypothetical protein